MKKLSMALAVILCSMILFTGCDAAGMTGGLINFENIANNIEGIGELLENIGDISSMFDELSNSHNDSETDDWWDTEKYEDSMSPDDHTETARPNRPNRPVDTQTDVDITETLPGYDADMPTLSGDNYGGRVLEIMAASDNNGWVTMNEDSVVNVAVYSRNMAIEEQLNVVIEYSFVEEVSSTEKTFQNHVINNCVAGMPVDMVIGRTSSLQTLALQGAMGDWNKSDVDIARQWWYQDAKDQFTTGGGRLYSLAGDGSHAILNNTLVTYFNINILESYDVDVNGFYSAVKDGEWTYDMMYSYAKDMYIDLDCNGAANTNDMLGYCVSSPASYAVVASSGEHMLIKKLSKWSMNEKWMEGVMSASDFVTSRYEHYGFSTEELRNMFAEERLVFMTESLSFAESLYEYGVNYGILPTPAYGRTEYSSVVMSNAPVLGYCNNIESVELVSDVADLMGYYGNQETMSAYFFRISQSSRDFDMLEIVRSTMFFDHEFLIGSSRLYSRVAKLIESGDSTIASTVAAHKEKVIAEVQEWSLMLDTLNN